MTTVAEFLRARRDQLQPADVGLPDHGRRRTPGLRREEVATLAGVSIDYLVRLEQGRDTRPSPSVTALLKGLGTTPAFVAGPVNDVLAWNDSWARLVRPLGLFHGAVPNLARHVFLHPDARTIYPDWTSQADQQISRLRAATARWGDDHDLATLMDDLRTSPDFNDRWSLFAATEKRRGTLRVVHPEIGQLRLNYEVLLLADELDDLRLVTWLPGDESAATALTGAGDRAVPSSPAHLRVIG